MNKTQTAIQQLVQQQLLLWTSVINYSQFKVTQSNEPTRPTVMEETGGGGIEDELMEANYQEPDTRDRSVFNDLQECKSEEGEE